MAELFEGRIPLLAIEHEAIDALLASLGDAATGACFSRRDPNELGPVLVTAGDETWEIAEDGTTTKVAP